MGDERTVRLLVEKGADVSAVDHVQQTPLHRAALKGHEAVARLLIEKGTDMMIVDRTKWTSLRLAAFNGQQAANGHEDVPSSSALRKGCRFFGCLQEPEDAT
jgi:ankyrin repeat protein